MEAYITNEHHYFERSIAESIPIIWPLKRKRMGGGQEMLLTKKHCKSHEDALEIRLSPFGSVGKVFSGEGIEAVWVKKQDEEIDPDWF